MHLHDSVVQMLNSIPLVNWEFRIRSFILSLNPVSPFYMFCAGDFMYLLEAHSAYLSHL